MKILHICLSCFYIDQYFYQENVLPIMHANMGHEVRILASTEDFQKNGKRGYTEPGSYINEYGIEVTRVAYKRYAPREAMRKIRLYKGVKEYLNAYKPDFIFFHGLCAAEIVTIAEYVRKNPQTYFAADSHEDKFNSAQNIISKYILHRKIYKRLICKALPQIGKIYCVSTEVMDFVQEMYQIPLEKMEYLPLGGTVLENTAYLDKREKKRCELGLDRDEILIIHSGKLSAGKKTTELLSAFEKCDCSNLRLVIIGVAEEKIQIRIDEVIQKDIRVRYLDWKSGEELQDYLCAADVYAQPGTQSATLQNAICARCAIMVYPYSSHRTMMQGNGYYIENERQIQDALTDVACHPEKLEQMKLNSLKVGKELLDYKRQAEKIIEVCEDV